jgi:hypothetical protein
MQGDTLPMTDWDLNKERAMASRAKILRDRMTEARMAEELCLHHTCGNKALMPSVVNHCETHLDLFMAKRMAKQRGKKPRPSK